ncbi:MAG: YHS domain-containing protein [Candidatus Omnitrophota bacterium]|nr:MAG: YHS domain-containing protein [Candidatus Omnitrophota bacterium]
MHEHADMHKNMMEQAEQSKAENVGNKICPVSGEKIIEEFKATYEYKGKIYNFCCASCVEEFKKDPEKYIKKIEEEEKAALKEENKVTKPDSDTHKGHQH